jgi:predicted Zn-dependent peptidase
MDAGILGVYVATDSQNVNPALETIQREVKKLSQGDVSDSDLVAAKDHLIGGIYLSSESSDNRMMRLARNELVFGRHVDYEELVTELERVTIDEVVQAACEIFADNKVSIATLGPLQKEDFDMGCLQFT